MKLSTTSLKQSLARVTYNIFRNINLILFVKRSLVQGDPEFFLLKRLCPIASSVKATGCDISQIKAIHHL